MRGVMLFLYGFAAVFSKNVDIVVLFLCWSGSPERDWRIKIYLYTYKSVRIVRPLMNCVKNCLLIEVENMAMTYSFFMKCVYCPDNCLKQLKLYLFFLWTNLHQSSQRH